MKVITKTISDGKWCKNNMSTKYQSNRKRLLVTCHVRRVVKMEHARICEWRHDRRAVWELTLHHVIFEALIVFGWDTARPRVLECKTSTMYYSSVWYIDFQNSWQLLRVQNYQPQCPWLNTNFTLASHSVEKHIKALLHVRVFLLNPNQWHRANKVNITWAHIMHWYMENVRFNYLLRH